MVTNVPKRTYSENDLNDENDIESSIKDDVFAISKEVHKHINSGQNTCEYIGACTEVALEEPNGGTGHEVDRGDFVSGHVDYVLRCATAKLCLYDCTASDFVLGLL